MSVESKEFWASHGMTIVMYTLTAILIFGEVGGLWSIGWFWCFAPIWIPWVAMFSMFGILFAVIACIIVASLVFGGISMLIDELKGLG